MRFFDTVFCFVVAAPVVCHADPHRWGQRGSQDVRIDSAFDGYAMLKGGGMMLNGAGTSSGGWFGLEVGRNTAGWVDAGFSLDWFHRRSRDTELLFEADHGFDPPIRAEVTRFESSTDFVPIGFTLRLRIPTGNEVIKPFVSGTLSYEVLHMSFYDRDRVVQPYDDLLGNSQTLTGFGWQVAGGVEFAITRQVGFFGEAGVHWSDPARELEDGFTTVDVSASLHGGFLRTGLRMSL
jgi:hypothetical protein